MVNYNNGKIYKIESHLGDKVYIGSTTKEYLSQRMTAHRTDYEQWLNGKNLRITSFDIFQEYGLENCQITLLESFPCKCRDELHARESFFIRSMDCVNRITLGRTQKEYYEDNKTEILKRTKENYQANKEHIQTYKKQYAIENKDKIKEYKRQHYEANKEKLSEQAKLKYELIKDDKNRLRREKYEANKDKRDEQRRIKRAAKKLEPQSTQ